MTITEIINQIHPISVESREKIANLFEEVNYPKSQIILKSNRVETNLYFIKKGLVRAFTYQNDQEITFWFGKENDIVLSMRSFIESKSAYENIELLENSVFYKINTNLLKDLFLDDLELANWGRRLFEIELLKTEERLISRQISTAKERYNDLMKNFPEYLMRIPLGYIASYLGITQVSLSRIRAEIK